VGIFNPQVRGALGALAVTPRALLLFRGKVVLALSTLYSLDHDKRFSLTQDNNLSLSFLYTQELMAMWTTEMIYIDLLPVHGTISIDAGYEYTPLGS
jgi:hypothetical protein